MTWNFLRRLESQGTLTGAWNFCRSSASPVVGSPVVLLPAASLLINHLDLLVDHLPGKPIDRNTHPVTLLAFDIEPSQIGFSRSVFAALCNHINQQVPSTRLIDFAKSPCDCLALRLWCARTESSRVWQARDQRCQPGFIHKRRGDCGLRQVCRDAICRWRRQGRR